MQVLFFAIFIHNSSPIPTIRKTVDGDTVDKPYTRRSLPVFMGKSDRTLLG